MARLSKALQGGWPWEGQDGYRVGDGGEVYKTLRLAREKGAKLSRKLRDHVPIYEVKSGAFWGWVGRSGPTFPGGRRNPGKSVKGQTKQLRNFTGTVTRLPNGQVIVQGVQR